MWTLVAWNVSDLGILSCLARKRLPPPPPHQARVTRGSGSVDHKCRVFLDK